MGYEKLGGFAIGFCRWKESFVTKIAVRHLNLVGKETKNKNELTR